MDDIKLHLIHVPYCSLIAFFAFFFPLISLSSIIDHVVPFLDYNRRPQVISKNIHLRYLSIDFSYLQVQPH